MTDFSPKLKQIRAEITAILEREDVGAHVILHDPGTLPEGTGYGEIFVHQPTYSTVTMIDPRLAYIRSKKADYGGDMGKMMLDRAATANMVSLFAELLSLAAVHFIDLQKVVDTKFGAEHRGGRFTPDSEDGVH